MRSGVTLRPVRNTKEDYDLELQRLRRYKPSGGHDLLGMELDFVAYLSGLEELDAATLTVRSTADPAGLIVAESLAAPGVAVAAAMESVRQVWLGQLGYTYSEAHYVEFVDERAVLHFVTQIGPGGFFVTGTVTVAPNGL